MTERTVTTIDHSRIRAWALARGGHPTVVDGAVDGEGRPVLRIAFKGEDAGLTEITWEEFFRLFDDGRLAMEYPEGSPHREHRLVSRAEAEEDTPR